jgi:hypothetical protein
MMDHEHDAAPNSANMACVDSIVIAKAYPVKSGHTNGLKAKSML